jgi:hypothetical protein
MNGWSIKPDEFVEGDTVEAVPLAKALVIQQKQLDAVVEKLYTLEKKVSDVERLILSQTEKLVDLITTNSKRNDGSCCSEGSGGGNEGMGTSSTETKEEVREVKRSVQTSLESFVKKDVLFLQVWMHGLISQSTSELPSFCGIQLSLFYVVMQKAWLFYRSMLLESAEL